MRIKRRLTAMGLASAFVTLGVTVLALAFVTLGTGCMEVVEPGYEGIRVHLTGTDRGVDSIPIVTGRVFYNPITYSIYEFPTYLQRIIWTQDDTEGSKNDDSFTFRSREGYSFNADVGFGYSFIENRTPEIFVKYRRTPREITDGPFRDIVREAFVQVGSQMGGLDILGSGVTDLNEGVTQLVRESLAGDVEVEYVHMVGQPRVDARVQSSIDAVIEATQNANKAEETVRQREAEARQRIAQAEGNAESMRIEAEGKATAIRIEAEALRQHGQQIIQMRGIEKWDGVMPLVVGEGSTPFVDLRGIKR